MASGLYVLIFDAVYGSRTLSLLLCTLAITEGPSIAAGIDDFYCFTPLDFNDLYTHK